MRAVFTAIGLASLVATSPNYAWMDAPSPDQLKRSVVATNVSGRCVALHDVRDADGDFSAANGAALANGRFCIRIAHFEDGGIEWTLEVIESGRPGPLWFAPHDDENVAITSALGGLTAYGGVLVAVETGGARLNGRIGHGVRDPNRIFGERGTCHKGGGPVAPIYTREVLQYLGHNQPIIALHSNEVGFANDGYGGSGDVSIDDRLPGRVHVHAPSPFPGARSPADTMVLVAGLTPRPSDALTQTIEVLRHANINVVYESVSSGTTDCSLSNYAALHHIGPYFNVEVVNGDASTQRAIVDVIARLR